MPVVGAVFVSYRGSFSFFSRDLRRRLRILARFRCRSNHPREDEAYHLGNEDAPRVILLVRCRHCHPRPRSVAGKHQAEDVRPTR